jgi:hypothetical protein
MQERFLSNDIILFGQLAGSCYYGSDLDRVSMPHRKAAQRLWVDIENPQCVNNVPIDKHPAVCRDRIL